MIISEQQQKEFYQALIDKNPEYEGTFFAGIKTTGIFCHSTCKAKKPKFVNCEFFLTAQEALLSGYRPCKRCNPLHYPNEIPEEIATLVAAVEKDPAKRWKESDFKELGIHSATARRRFKEVYGMTFVQYARSRRMGIAFKEILKGKKVIDQQLATGYESASAFTDAFTKIMGNSPQKANILLLYANIIATPIGRMISLSTEKYLFLLEFIDRRGLEREIEKIRKKHNARVISGQTPINEKLAYELNLYFSNKLDSFSVPLFLDGTEFQKKVWNELKKIPLGQVSTYQTIANNLGDLKYVRAVGNANGANQISILIPCHRVIKSNGDLGGYGGGVTRKKYLLDLENFLHSENLN
ncbi:MAG: trifunctional transcriptional activator/DNA repair protein Ada/methylated-DNA--[protein]-cysteine S-methyltransferase [Bacillus sp. (in: firmicutes)]